MSTRLVGLCSSVSLLALDFALGAAPVSGQSLIAFDSIDPDGGPIGGMGCLGCEQARLALLEAHPGDMVDLVELRLWNSNAESVFSDPVRASIYGFVAGQRELLSSVMIDLTLNPNENRIVAFDLPDATLSSTGIWIGLYTPSEDPLIWTSQFDDAGTIGSMTPNGGTRPNGEGEWTGSFSSPVAQQARVILVPGPSVTAGLLTAMVFVGRRRREHSTRARATGTETAGRPGSERPA
ncbi:MAG: hypothetical protein AAGF47_06695 [Planctomycetota bacterium]